MQREDQSLKHFNTCYVEMIKFSGAYECCVLMVYCLVIMFTTIYCLIKQYLTLDGMGLIYFILFLILLIASTVIIILSFGYKKDVEKNFNKIVIIKNTETIFLYSTTSIMFCLTSKMDGVFTILALINYVITIILIPIAAYIRTRTYIISASISVLACGLLDLIFGDIRITLTEYLILVCALFVGLSLQLMKISSSESVSKYHNEKMNSIEALKRLNEEITRLNNELKVAAKIDSLTSLYNRSYLTTQSEIIWKECFKNKEELSVVMIDVDKFKQINDIYGHAIGDICLKKVANVITEHVISNNGLAFRYGGEEFVIIFTKETNDIVKEHITLLADNIADLYIKEIDGKQITISCGVYTQIPDEKTSFSNYITHADKLMYEQKNNKIEYR